MLKFWINTFAMILIGTLIGGAVLYGISMFAGLPLNYRMACGVSFIGTYFSAINTSREDPEKIDLLESSVHFLVSCGIVSIAVLLMHFGFKFFGA